MKENAVRESICANFANIKHIAGMINLSDIMMKDDRGKFHYIAIQDTVMTPIAEPSATTCQTPYHKSEKLYLPAGQLLFLS
eukprot:1681345-Ditylum_brightwellii.AAC.1